MTINIVRFAQLCVAGLLRCVKERRNKCQVKCVNARVEMFAPHADTSFQQSLLCLSREKHEEEVRRRAQRILEEKRTIAEKKQLERERAAKEAKLVAMQRRITGIQQANRATEYRMQQAKMLQEERLQASEDRLKAELLKIDEASDRRGIILESCRFRTAQHLFLNSQRAQFNRSAIDTEVQARLRRQKERENARQKAVLEEKLTREIELQRRGLLHDQRRLSSVEYRIQQELVNREKWLQQERAHEERLWQLKLQRGTDGFGKTWHPAQRGRGDSSALIRREWNASDNGGEDNAINTYQRPVTS
ncbi:uncharacterized protein Tco025E_05794 [Trypanosoma conorhini]|uniref:Trichohyalin-plectin-homology domain-containing protein n=1 Tax=Trypanosoma conorhini TaxID=83891 RepID=A0A3R7N1Q0_9TRYP|nr:uncharacterized protein Tco025E_05794 [Trypanosoma conorhini]RNF14523.1 hypothetical protein Tco025E_05794 [Trypanosoma conorhini]